MKKLVCFIIGHRMTPTSWYPVGIIRNKWFREFFCERCDKKLHVQTINSAIEPHNEWRAI